MFSGREFLNGYRYGSQRERNFFLIADLIQKQLHEEIYIQKSKAFQFSQDYLEFELFSILNY
jgi:hypothetical protein